MFAIFPVDFFECLVAPSVSSEAAEILKMYDRLRVMVLDVMHSESTPRILRPIAGGIEFFS